MAKFKFSDRTIDTFSLAFIFIYSLAIWWPTRNLPYHWDSAGFVVNATRQLRDTNFLPFVAEHSDFAHPPLLMAALAGGWNMFGETVLVSHLLMLPILPILLFATYWLASKLLPRYQALLATILTGITPFIISEYGQIYIDLPMAAFTTLAFAAAAHRRYFFSAISLAIAALIKESALMYVPIIGLLIWLEFNQQSSPSNQPKRTKSVKRKSPKYEIVTPAYPQTPLALLWLLLPLAAYFAWLYYHFASTGWWLIRPDRPPRVPQDILTFWSSLKFMLTRFLFSQGRWWLTILSLWGLGDLLFNRHKRKILTQPLVLTLLAAVGLGLLSFALIGEFSLRYGIFFVPAYSIVAIYLTDHVVDFFTKRYRPHGLIGVGLIAIWLYTFNWHPPISRRAKSEWNFRPQMDLSYQDIIGIGQRTANYLAINAPEGEIYGDFPEVYQLTQPYQGYVSQPLDFHKCNEFIVKPDKQQILLIHPYSPGQQVCRNLLNIIEGQSQLHIERLQLIEQHDKWVEIFQITVAEDATGEAEGEGEQ